MKSIKSVVLFVLIAFSLVSFSSVTLAQNAKAVANITAHTDEAIKSINANNIDEAITHIKQAKRAKGELNSEGNAAKIGRLAAHFNKAKKRLKKSDQAGAIGELELAKQGFNSLTFK